MKKEGGNMSKKIKKDQGYEQEDGWKKGDKRGRKVKNILVHLLKPIFFVMHLKQFQN